MNRIFRSHSQLNISEYFFSPIKRTHSHIGSLSHEKSTSAFRPLICILLIFEFLTVHNSTRVNIRLSHAQTWHVRTKSSGNRKVWCGCDCVQCACVSPVRFSPIYPRSTVNVTAATVKIYVFLYFRWRLSGRKTPDTEAYMKSFSIFR